ncbi:MULTISPECIES: LysR family transcriptional regulator [unclassified Beijerinckia]|uniref:LysR family transcriptional regulator n=1 Tax=unclassified Beijerinckia TaxID=2638183 RepID=UPI0008980668|nr:MULTISPECIES: LysR family transcriptional regulator [unclassified Beijerinckia]MDH7795165.1 DNA-binding transcriptional LysR family regulator [Beijerinckia sp. GAS462]SEB90246.1 transcriptional regulator, LysR family [Beijerinckia sp. 28-YEA-48]
MTLTADDCLWARWDVTFNWNDLRYVLAVARQGSTLAAASVLGVNQTTVARRIDMLEQALDIQLFERRPEGYRITQQGQEALAVAERIEREAAALADGARSWRRQISGVVRITATELVATELLAPLIAELRQRHPLLQIELIADDRRFDLTRGEADVAVRVGQIPDDPSIVRRWLGRSVWSIYCSQSYAQHHGTPLNLAELDEHQIIGGSGQLDKLAPLLALREAAPRAAIAVRCNSVANLIAAVRSGIGIGPLPGWADGDDLVRCPLPELETSADIWLLFPESQRSSRHVRTVVDALISRFETVRSRLEGRS